MAFITGLQKIQEVADRASGGDQQERRKVPWMKKFEPGESRRIRFLQEFDPDSPLTTQTSGFAE